METAAISHPRAITTIREPIHGAIDLTCFEREIVDSPYFQRLHFVLQNSTTYAAYPSNKNSRFVHSLGVASVVGDLLVSSLRNSPKDELSEFLTQAARHIHDHYIASRGAADAEDRKRKRLIDGWKSTIYGHSRFSHRSFLKDAATPLCPDDLDSDTTHGLERDFIVDTLWEACRLCGLIHDIGHLPMSHSFEMGLKRIDSLFDQYPGLAASRPSRAEVNDDAIVPRLVSSHGVLLEQVCSLSKERLAEFLLNEIEVHERRGLLILQYIRDADEFGCNNGADYGETPIGSYRDLIYEMALLILYASSADEVAIPGDSGAVGGAATSFPGFIRTLKTIVAGEVDADRLDYTIRDGHACGSEIGTFDIGRVVSNAVLRKHDETFRVMYYERAISGLEHFFTQRHDGYKYLIYHRTSSRTEACLQELLGRLLHAAIISPQSIIAQRMKEFGYIGVNDEPKVSSILPFSEDAMGALDDANLRTMFVFLRRDLAPHRNDPEYSGLLQQLIWPICCLLDILTVRDFSALMSPYKNHAMARELADLLEEKRTEDPATYGGLWEDGVSVQDSLSDALSSTSQKVFAVNLRRGFEARTSGKAILLISHQKPKVFSERSVSPPDWLYVVEHSGDIVSLSSRSPLLANMYDNLKRSTGISMAIVSDGIKTRKEDMDAYRRDLNTVLLDNLVAYHRGSLPLPPASS